MDPNTGKLYTQEEAAKLPLEIRQRLVPAPRPVKRKKQKAITYTPPPKNLAEKRRKTSKRAKQARKKNRN